MASIGYDSKDYRFVVGLFPESLVTPGKPGTEITLGSDCPVPYLRDMAKQRRPSKKPKSQVPSSPRPRSGPSFGEKIALHPVRWAIIAYLLLTIIVFAGPIFSPDKMVFGTDTMTAGVFFRSFHAEFWREHFRMPMWNPYIHAGLPFVDAMHGDIFYPAAILQILLPVTYALGLKLILHVFFAGVFMFLFLRGIGHSDTSAFVGGLLYMFAPFLVSLIYPGHDGKMYVTALTPLAFLALYRAVISRRLVAFLGFGLVYALMILTAHVQMAYYAAWGLGLYFIFLLWDRYRFRLGKSIPLVVSFVLAVGLSLGASSVQWMTPYKYTEKYSQRILQQGEESGYEWSSSWSMNSEELASVINPEFSGDNVGSRQPSTYWGQNYFKLNSESVGVMAVALAVVALFAVRTPPIAFFAGLSLIALLYAMGSSTPVFHIFYNFVPMVKKFRAPSMIVFLFGFAWIAMATAAIDALQRDPAAPKRKDQTGDAFKVLRITAIVYSAIALVAILLGTSFLTGWASFVGHPLTAQKLASAQADTPYVRIGFAVGVAIIWAVYALFQAYRRSRIGKTGLFVGLAILALIPNWWFNSRFVKTINPDPIYGERPILELIRKNAPEGPYRVLNIRGLKGQSGGLDDNYLALHDIEELSPTAMHGNHLLTQDVFVGRHDSQPALLTNPATMNLMNTELVLSTTPFNIPDLKPVGQAEGFTLYRNTASMPRAAVFYHYEVEPDTTAQLVRIRTFDFPYRSLLLLEQQIPDFPPRADGEKLTPFTPAKVIDWDVDRFTVEYTAARDGLLWLSENYYPAWIATDESGQQRPIYRANYAFRAVPVEAGTHRITFEFHSDIFANALWLSLICGLVLLGGGALSLRGGRARPPLQAPHSA